MDIKRNTWVNGGAYLLALIGTILAQAKGIHALEYVCKPALLLILSSWFFFNSRRYGDRFTLMVQLGLFFSLVGDVALMFLHLDEFNFLVGLGAFLLAHICYTIAFVRNISEVGGTEGWILSSILSLIIALFAILFAWELQPRLDAEMTLPVLSYITVIAIMGIVACFRYMRTFPRSFWLVFVGALCFIASDSLLATNRFIRPLSWAPLALMVSYGAAQFLIAAGSLLHVLAPDTIRRKQATEA
jgi:uncharacterized membrane protein YhhN